MPARSAENRIKEAQTGLFATLTSCSHFQSNPLHMLLAAPVFVLIERMYTLALAGTELAFAHATRQLRPATLPHPSRR